MFLLDHKVSAFDKLAIFISLPLILYFENLQVEKAVFLEFLKHKVITNKSVENYYGEV